MPILDFKELSLSRSDSPPGEDLEGLVRELGKRLGLDPTWSGRGADQGRDLIFVEYRKGPLSSRSLRWLLSCKDFARSGRSVSEADVGSVSDKVAQHGADGFLLATSTTASTALKSMLDGLNAKGEIEVCVWDRHELENLLIQDAHRDIVKQYLPEGYSSLLRLSALPQALDSLEKLVPDPIYKKILEVIKTYKFDETWLAGERIWPHDRASAATIDRAVASLLERGDAREAAEILSQEEIEYDAFEVTLKTLNSFNPAQTQELCRELVHVQDASGPSLFAYRFYVDHYEPSNEDQIALSAWLTSEDLYELYGEETAAFIGEHFTANPARYRAWSDLDQLSSRTGLEAAYSQDIEFKASADKSSIEFRASLILSVSLSYDHEEMTSRSSFPGQAEGYINSEGIFLDDVTVDTRSFYE